MTQKPIRQESKESELNAAFAKKNIPLQVFYYSSVTSTMDAAKANLASVSSESPAIFIADMQTGGRGRQSRSWESLAGNLFMTMVFAMNKEVNHYAGYSLAMGLGLNKSLAALGCRTRLKWPNDLLSLSEKKLAGILIEIAEHGGKKFMLCGIGINVVSHPKDIPNVTDVNTIAGQDYTAAKILVGTVPTLIEQNEKFVQSGFARFKPDWMANAAFVGREVNVNVSADKILKGMFIGVNSSGALQVEIGGKIETLAAGDIALI